MADRLRLERKAQVRAGAIAQAGEVFGAREEIATHDLKFVGIAAEALERTRQRADGADLIRRTKCSEKIEETVGVFETRRLAPVRCEDVVLHGLAVERAEGEAVNPGDNAVLFV